MEEEKKEKATNLELLRHFIASAIIYGIILLCLIFCPAYYETIEENSGFDYTIFFTVFYLGYLLIAPIIYWTVRPISVKDSRNMTIFGYFARQFSKDMPVEHFLKGLEPTEKEKQAMMIVFMQTFFGVYCVNTLCNNYLPSFGYNLDFLKVMFEQAVQYITAGSGILSGIIQYLNDTGDMWIKLAMTINLIILAISYLSDLDLFKNKIKSVDTTPLGVISCIMCYYPVVLLTDKFLQVTEDSLLPVNNSALLAGLNLFAIIANFGMMIAVLRLGTKSGNLTNRSIVTGFPYNVVRHPEYSMQIFYIIITTIPLYLASDMGYGDKFFVTVTTLAWIFIYYLRAITEERHLIKDSKYQEYVLNVKHRFLPWLI